MGQQRFVRKNMAVYDTQLRQEKKRTRRTVFYVLLFLFVTLVFLAVCAAVFLNIETINVNGNTKYTYDEIRELVPITEGENIFSFKASKIEEELTKTLPYVGSVDIDRDLPTTVDINITEEEPCFATRIANDTYILSSELKVIEVMKDTDPSTTGLTLLTLNNVRQCILGSKLVFVNERSNAALTALYDALERNYIDDKIKAVDMRTRFDIYIHYDNRFEVYIGDTESIDIKIRFLVAILDELEEDATGTIDISDPREASVALS